MEKQMTIGVVFLTLFFLLSCPVSALADCCPPCGECEYCDDGECVTECGFLEFCCHGNCCSFGWFCCNDGHCCPSDKICCGSTCCDSETQCCMDGQCKQCCKDHTTGNCEAHNSDCGCDPLGFGDCYENVKEWTLGSTHFCYSECGGGPCNYTLTDIPCYAWRSCKTATNHYDSFCFDPAFGCEGTIYGFCQTCMPDGDATVVEAWDCRCQ